MYDLTPAGLAELFGRLRSSERAEWIAEASRLTGHSASWFYSRAKAGGWTSGRKKRADAGEFRSGLSHKLIYQVAAVKLKATRDNGKMIAGTHTALSLLHGAPLETLDNLPSVGTVNRALRSLGLGRDRIKRVRVFERVNKSTGEVCRYVSEATGILHSDYPNQEHQVDTSVCVIYQFTKANQFKIAVQNRLYKNKPQNFIRMVEKRKLIIRYVLVDHCSGSLYFRYFESGGENAADMGEFLFHAWRKKDFTPFRGTPDALRGDAGAGLSNRLIKNGLDKLEVRLLSPLPGNKEANGAVENAHNLIEMKFESLLGFQTVPNLDTLNRLAENACAYLNNVFVHSRLGATRAAVWSMLPAWKLREVPQEWEAFRGLFDIPETRKVAFNGSIQFRGLIYRTRDPELAGETVTVHFSPYEHPAVVLSHIPSGKRLLLHPLPVDRYGRIVTGANQATGMFDRLADSASVDGVKRALAAELSVDGRALVEAMGASAAQPQYLGDYKQGVTITGVPAAETEFESRLDAKNYLDRKYGPLDLETMQGLNARLPEHGIPVALAEEILHKLIRSGQPKEKRQHA